MSEIRACADSLLGNGVCCWPDCDTTASIVVLTGDLVEHVRCLDHVASAEEVVLGTKAFVWAPEWKPTR